VASRREGALARTGLAQTGDRGGARGVRGSGPHCRKRPGLGSTAPRVAEAHSLESFAGEAKLTRYFAWSFSFSTRLCSMMHIHPARSARGGFFSHPSRGGTTFSSPFPSVTPAGGELRRAPLSVYLHGQRTTAQQQLLCLQFSVPRAGTRRRDCAGDRRARSSPLPASPPGFPP
jgi:hypothetical protein